MIRPDWVSDHVVFAVAQLFFGRLSTQAGSPGVFGAGLLAFCADPYPLGCCRSIITIPDFAVAGETQQGVQ